MFILIDHDHCKHPDSYSDLCLAKTIRHPLGHEKSCLAEIRDDGREAITVVLRQDGEDRVRVFESEKTLEAMPLVGSELFLAG